MPGLKEMILQLFLTLLPFLCYNVYYRNKAHNYSPAFILLTTGISLFLSMTFNKVAVNGFIYDARYILMFFGLLFGGLRIGFVLLAGFMVYRLYLGGPGVEIAMGTILVSFPVSILLSHLYRRVKRRPLFFVVSALLISLIPTVMLYLYNPDILQESLLFYLLYVPFLNFIGIWLLLSLFQRAVIDKNLSIIYAQKEKLETIGQVAASLVHEVRNPLTAVKGFLKLISETSGNQEKVHRYIEICVSEMERAEYILSEYLAITKPSTDRREQVNLNAILQITVDVMRPYANMNNVELQLQHEDGVCRVMGNPEKIKQVLMNLIKNAIEACYDTENAVVSLTLEPLDNEALLYVRDNGIGMSREQAERLGSVFYSTKTTGTGLGLAFSYQVIEELGGSVQVRSEPRQGTEFAITLPLCEPSANAV